MLTVKRPIRILAALLSISVPGLVQPFATLAEEMSPESLLKEGLHQEQNLRQPEGACVTYRRVVAFQDAPAEVRAEALLRLGLCLERMGRTEEARQQLERVAREFADQRRIVDHARRRLAAISAGDPASLMPVSTLLYVELVRPGLQAEQFIASLKGVDEAGLERLLNRLGLQRDLRTFRATFTDAMREDINRIDSLALGIISKEPLPGATDYKFLLTLHPGRGFATRGVLTMMAQSAGQPSGAYGEVKLWAIPDGDDGVFTFANLGSKQGQGGVMLLGKDRQVVCQAIDRWRDGAKAGSLASVPEFRRQAAARRLDSAILVYGDVARILTRLRDDLGPDDRTRYEAGQQLLALDAIERGMARAALLDNGLLLEMSLMFNEKDNPFYALFQTPPADRSLLAFVPTETAAAFLMSMGHGSGRWGQVSTFLNQLGDWRNVIGGPDMPDLREAIRQAQSMTGLSFAEDVLDNCRSLAVIVPTIAPSTSEFTDSPLANVVLVLRTHDPEALARKLTESLLDRLQVALETSEIAGVRVHTYIDTPTASGAALSVARIGDVFLVTLSAEMLEHVLLAHRRDDVMERSRLGRPAVSAIPASASKILLFRPELIANDLRSRRERETLPFKPVCPIVAYTIEQARQMALRVEISDLTGLLNNAILAAGSASPATVPAGTTTVAATQPARFWR
ncbi:MAG: tetratricopeptide repeat protein [Phycisphaerae bacterium]|nr:tetratricopeptide repeat protein [Phycisphaerae bacterium]